MSKWADDESADSCCALCFSDGGFGAYTVDERPGVGNGSKRNHQHRHDTMDCQKWTRAGLFQLGGFTVIHFKVGSVQTVDESVYDSYPVALSKGGLGASVVEETPGMVPG